MKTTILILTTIVSFLVTIGCTTITTSQSSNQGNVKTSYFDLSKEDQKNILESKVSYTRMQADQLIQDMLFILNEKQSRYQFVLNEKKGMVLEVTGLKVWCPNFVTIRDRKTDDVYSCNFAIMGYYPPPHSTDIRSEEKYVVGGSVMFLRERDELSPDASKAQCEFIERNLNAIFYPYVNSKIIDDLHYNPRLRAQAQAEFHEQLEMNPLFLGN